MDSLFIKRVVCGILLLGLSPLAWGQELSFDAVVEKAVLASPELKMAQLDVGISKADVKKSRADYYPVLRGQVNVEYIKDLQALSTPTTVVGDTVIPAGTRFQNSIGLNLNQTVFDWGTRHNKVLFSKKDVLAKNYIYDRTLRDFKVKLVDLYQQTLISWVTLQAKHQILERTQQIYQMKKRLFEAGTISKVVLAEQAIQVAQVLDEIQTLQHQLQLNMDKLSLYTRETYSVSDTVLTGFPDGIPPTDEMLVFQPEQTLEAKLYQMEIEKKEQEISVIKKRYLPQLVLYTKYNLYGFDESGWGNSVKDIHNRILQTGIGLQLPIFDGFKTQADLERAKLEKEKLMAEREKKLNELAQQVQEAKKQSEFAQSELQNKSTYMAMTDEKKAMTERLASQRVIDKTQPLQDEIAHITRQLDIDKTNIQQLAARTRLRILQEG